MVDRMFGGSGPGGGGPPFNWNSLFTMSDISSKTQAHLTRVYTTLLASAASCVLGMYINATFMLTGFLLTILSIMVIAFLMYQVSNQR